MNKYIINMRSLRSADPNFIYNTFHIEAHSAQDAMFMAKNNGRMQVGYNQGDDDQYAFDIYCVENKHTSGTARIWY